MRDRNPGLASVTPEPAWSEQDVTQLPRAVPGESSLLNQNWRITTLTFAEDGQQISISLRIKGARSTCAAGGQFNCLQISANEWGSRNQSPIYSILAADLIVLRGGGFCVSQFTFHMQSNTGFSQLSVHRVKFKVAVLPPGAEVCLLKGRTDHKYQTQQEI